MGFIFSGIRMGFCLIFSDLCDTIQKKFHIFLMIMPLFTFFHFGYYFIKKLLFGKGKQKSGTGFFTDITLLIIIDFI